MTSPRLGVAIRPYRREWLRGDVLAGLAAGAVVIPQAMAYATVANMPVETGLYTCMVPLVVYAFVGGSRTASVTSTSTIATLTASTLLAAGVAAGAQDAGDAQAHLIMLTLLVGTFLLLARVLHMGSVIENINEATLIGLKAGVGLTVAATQLPKLLGVAPNPHEDGFFRVLWSALRQLSQAHPLTVLLSVASIATLLVLAKAVPRIPGQLVVVVVGILLASLGALPEVALIPQVPQGIPLPGLPDFSHIVQLVPGALAIAVMAFLETVSVARSMRRPDEPQIDPDRELAATGLAAVVGSFFHALPPSGGFSQTGVNVRAGAKSQLASLVTATLSVVVALFLAPLLSKLPQAILGAMVFVAVLGLIDVVAFRRLYRFDKTEFALAAIVGVFGLTAGLLPAVAVGVVLMLYSVLREVNHPHVVQVVRGSDGTWRDGSEDVLTTSSDPLVVRTQFGLYTANLRANSAVIQRFVDECTPRPTRLVWDLSRQPTVSSTILDGLRELDSELAGDGTQVVFAALPESARAMAKRWPWWADVERQGRVYASVDDAVRSPSM